METLQILRQAEALLEDYGPLFLSDPKIVDLLGRLESAIEGSREAMERAGISVACSRCEKEEGGSCCGRGIEKHYTEWLLLVNLLLGVDLPSRRSDARSCFFLDESGCTLRARHIICINYLCQDILKNTDPILIRELREKEGEEALLLFALVERLKQRVRQHG